MADVTTADDGRNREPERPRGVVALADESPDELPALLALAVGVAILAIAIVWPTIDPGNDANQRRTVAAEAAASDDHGEGEAGADDESADASEDGPEDGSENSAAGGLDLAALRVGLSGLGLGDVDLSADDGVVTASGQVPDEGTRATVIDYLGSQPGVESVIDELSIAPAADSTQGDATLTAAQASVVLTGTVPDEATAQLIYDRAVSIYSEDQVDNQMVVDADRAPPTQITIAGALTDEVLFRQISTAFDDLDGVEVAPLEIALEESGELETSLNSLEPIQFASGSAIIDEASSAILDEAADFLTASPDVAVEIGGHTDSRGSDESNQTLSQDRADAVKAALVERGVSNDLSAVGFGERRLKIDPDDTPEAQQENRRIEFRLLN